jgi:hypothetical protein
MQAVTGMTQTAFSICAFNGMTQLYLRDLVVGKQPESA